MSLKRIFIALVLICGGVLGAQVEAQEWNYARLSLLYGGSIPFNFNSIKAYSEGIEIIEGTVLGITLVDSTQVGHTLEGFDLVIKTFNGQAVISGNSSNLPLNRIRIKAENFLGLGTGITFNYQDLEATESTLFSYRSSPFSDLIWDTHQLALSYECGKPVSAGGNGSLLGEDPDYYTVELEVELIPMGPGF